MSAKTDNVREIVKEYLESNGFDGLYCPECGCRKEDLMPCEMPCELCKPGYLTEGDGRDGFDFHISEKKPK